MLCNCYKKPRHPARMRGRRRTRAPRIGSPAAVSAPPRRAAPPPRPRFVADAPGKRAGPGRRADGRSFNRPRRYPIRPDRRHKPDTPGPIRCRRQQCRLSRSVRRPETGRATPPKDAKGAARPVSGSARRLSVTLALRAQQVAQHVLHDAAVAVVVRLAGGVDAHDRVELDVPPAGARVTVRGVVPSLSAVTPVIGERLLAGQAQRVGALRPPGTAAAARPCRSGSSGGCARRTRR